MECDKKTQQLIVDDLLAKLKEAPKCPKCGGKTAYCQEAHALSRFLALIGFALNACTSFRGNGINR